MKPVSVSCTSNKSSIDKYSWYLLDKQEFRCHPGCQKYKAIHRILIHATLWVLLWAKHYIKLFDNYLFKIFNPLGGASLVSSVVKNPLPMQETGSIPGSGRSPGEGNGNPLQYSCLENAMDRRGWWAAVHGVTRSWTGLSTHARIFAFPQHGFRDTVFPVPTTVLGT